MLAKRLTPTLDVSDIQQSFAWFEQPGWKKGRIEDHRSRAEAEGAHHKGPVQ